MTLRPFRPEDQPVVRELILAGLEEHWGFRDLTKNPDLDDIASSYRGATFLVAWCDDQIVGTGALVPRGSGTAQVVRMSVASSARRLGIGTCILRELCRRARIAGLHRVVLETTSTWGDVTQFYVQCGFRETHVRGGNTHFELDLGSPA